MKFIADLHVHSHFSRATAKNLDIENLYIAAQIKGITLVGTGDFTHPAWFKEIESKLTPTGGGFFRLKKNIAADCDKHVPPACRRDVRFVLSSEISNIYKKTGKTRKNHNLVFLPDLDSARRFNSKLDAIGNICSDGRPILGLDARNLFEILLDISQSGVLIPAHIWTPWFSVLGSKSGFDSIEACFEDLAPYIFAVETGLSSDPPMNWRVPHLDGMTLISNSDAHSPLNMGREANMFNTDCSYDALMKAIKSGNPEKFKGTIEFYPEEGKYHLDGHRNCGLCFRPQASLELNGICPHCGRPLTLGVLYRVEELAERPAGSIPKLSHPYIHSVPLVDILSEIFDVGAKSKKVQGIYRNILEKAGSEIDILINHEIEQIDGLGIPLLGEAISRVRTERVKITPGYDGEYGKINIFSRDERIARQGQAVLFQLPTVEAFTGQVSRQLPEKREREKKTLIRRQPNKIKTDKALFNEQQRQAIAHSEGPLLIVAGPGTGKTYTLTHRIAHLINQKKVFSDQVLAVTFTRKAAEEMEQRLKRLIDNQKQPWVTTFHALGYHLLNDRDDGSKKTIIAEEDRLTLIHLAVCLVKKSGLDINCAPRKLLSSIILAKQRLIEPEGNLGLVCGDIDPDRLSAVYGTYQKLLTIQNAYDYEDLHFFLLKRFESDKVFCEKYKNRFSHVFVDEYQDINPVQHEILKKLSTLRRNICVIGDPNQSIYGFRGASALFFDRFKQEYPDAEQIFLTRNYRSTETIVRVSGQVIASGHKYHGKEDPKKEERPVHRIYSTITGEKTIHVLNLATERAEAVAIGKTIEDMIGGIGFHYSDFGGRQPEGQRSFADFAVLFRTTKQRLVFIDVFKSAGIPFQTVSRENLFLTKEIAETLSVFKIIEDAGTFADLERVKKLFKPGLTQSQSEAFISWAYDNNFNLSEALFHAGRIRAGKLDPNGRVGIGAFVSEIKRLKSETTGMKVSEKLAYIGQRTGLESRSATDIQTQTVFQRMIATATDYGRRAFDFIAAVSLGSDTDMYDHEAEKVSLMTMHAAKGLEFPVVFISGCEKGYIPMDPRRDAPGGGDDERRLFYVATTRAKEVLFLTWTRNRTLYGRRTKRILSPFVDDIEQDLKQIRKPVVKATNKKKQRQLELF